MISKKQNKKHKDRGNKLLRILDIYLGIPLIFLLSIFRAKKKYCSKTPRRIAILKTAAIGDTIILSGPIRDIRIHWPQAEITFFAGASNIEAARLLDNIDHIHKVPIRNVLQVFKLMRSSGTFDIWFDFGSWPRFNAFLSYWARARYKIGFKTPGQYRHYVYDRHVLHRNDIHELENYQNIIKSVGLTPCSLPCISHGPKPIAQKYAVVHMWPGGSRANLKEWPGENWQKIIFFLQEQRLKVILTGAPSQRKVVDEFIALYGKDNIMNSCGEFSLKGLCALLAHARVVVSVDTGTAHMAAALSAPLVVVHGPTSPARWGPVGPNEIKVVTASYHCSPCLSLGFETKCSVNLCMSAITPEMVIQAINKYNPGRD